MKNFEDDIVHTLSFALPTGTLTVAESAVKKYGLDYDKFLQQEGYGRLSDVSGTIKAGSMRESALRALPQFGS